MFKTNLLTNKSLNVQMNNRTLSSDESSHRLTLLLVNLCLADLIVVLFQVWNNKFILILFYNLFCNLVLYLFAAANRHRLGGHGVLALHRRHLSHHGGAQVGYTDYLAPYVFTCRPIYVVGNTY